MYYSLALLAGVLVAIMIALNGALGVVYGIYASSVVIHLVGLVLITALAIIKREKLFFNRVSWVFYLGGAIGVLSVFFTNMAFARISVSAILALGLFGQGLVGLLVDQYGWMGMPQHPFYKRKLIGLALVLGAIVAMVDNFELVAVILSFFGGVNIVFARTLNARLAEATSVRVSTFYNFFIGVLVSLAVYLLLGRNEVGFVAALEFSSNWYLYIGGAVGVFVVILTNITVVKISAFSLALLLFVGQVASGIVIDILLTGEFSLRNLIGGLLIAVSLIVDFLNNRKMAATRGA